MKRQNETLFYILEGSLTTDAQGFLVDIESSEFEKLALQQINEVLSQKGLTAENLVVATPGHEVLQLFMEAPNVGGKKLERALYWLCENQVSTPMEDSCFFWIKHPSQAAPNRCLVSIINPETFEGWLQVLNAAGLTHAELTTMGQLLYSETSSSFLWLQSVYWNSSEGMGVLAAGAESALSDEVKDELTPDDLLSLLKETQKQPRINFGLKSERYTQWKQYFPLRPVAAGLAACLVVICSYFLTLGLAFEKQALEIAEQARNQYVAWFPNDRRVINVRRQLEGKLNQNANNAGTSAISPLLNTLSLSLEQSINRFDVERIRFQRDSGTIQVVLIVEKIDDISRLEELMAARSIDLDIQSATRRSSGLEVGLILTPRLI